MAPVLALGPSLCVEMGVTPPNGPFFVPSADLSMVPSALNLCQHEERVSIWWRETYKRGFFLGPGFPLGFAFEPDSACAALLFVPGLGPGTPFRLPFVVGGANELLSVAVASVPGAGVAFESEGSGAGALMRGVAAGGGEAVGDSEGEEGKFASFSAAKRRMTVLESLVADLVADLEFGVTAMAGVWSVLDRR